MKVLIVCSGNHQQMASFITEQAESLKKQGLEIDFFLIKGSGAKGYLKSFLAFKKKLRSYKPDVIHAHYGLSGLLCNLQRKIPVVTTYHGSDINIPTIRFFSKISILLSAHNVFVAEKLSKLVGNPVNSSIIPCGVDISVFKPIEKQTARKFFQWVMEENVVLFAGAFNNPVKNYTLAQKSIQRLENVKLIELKGYTRNEVALLFSAVDVALMTSHSEGSPQFIKEALACNCPVVSVDVGDVKSVMEGVENTFVVNDDELVISDKISQILVQNSRSVGVDKITQLQLDLESVAKKLIAVYQSVC